MGLPTEFQLLCWCEKCDKEITVTHQADIGYFTSDTRPQALVFKDAGILQIYAKKYPDEFWKEVWNDLLEQDLTVREQLIATKKWVIDKIIREEKSLHKGKKEVEVKWDDEKE